MIKTILKDAMILLKLNMWSEFLKAELISQQALIHVHGEYPKTLGQIQSYLGAFWNIVKVSFETETASKIMIERKLHKQYAIWMSSQKVNADKVLLPQIHMAYNHIQWKWWEETHKRSCFYQGVIV